MNDDHAPESAHDSGRQRVVGVWLGMGQRCEIALGQHVATARTNDPHDALEDINEFLESQRPTGSVRSRPGKTASPALLDSDRGWRLDETVSFSQQKTRPPSLISGSIYGNDLTPRAFRALHTAKDCFP
jgi:hypothetical protein